MSQMRDSKSNPTPWQGVTDRGLGYRYINVATSAPSTFLRPEPLFPEEPPKSFPGASVNVRSGIAPKDGLFPEFKVRHQPSKFFKVGRVFLTLWSEPAGLSGSDVTEPGTTLNQFGERVFSKVRRFVVIRESTTYSSCLPITTYGGQGVSKPRTVKSEHAIMHTGRDPPRPSFREQPRPGENPMQPVAIRVDPDVSGDGLDSMSRIDFGGVCKVQHNVKVKSFGLVNKSSMEAFKGQFATVWGGTISGALPSRGQDTLSQQYKESLSAAKDSRGNPGEGSKEEFDSDDDESDEDEREDEDM